ncbi:MAG: PP2C family protein-serine/threonine phosphatase, partial [Acidimicrobiales bacterium]
RGHGLRAALLGALAITAMRNSRRCSEGLVDQARAANAALLSQFSEEDFVTAVLLRIDLPSGSTAVINAGHPQPLLLRQGQCLPVTVESQHPLGMFDSPAHAPGRITLDPDDRLVLFTDGITEAAPDGGNAFGLPQLVELLAQTRAQPPTEAVRIISGQVLAHRAGQLSDDATIVLLDWHGDRPYGALKVQSP